MAIIDIRQSDEWSKYLEFYNWKSEKLTNGSIIRFIPFLGLSFGKLQRPLPLTEADLTEISAICKKNRAFSLKIFPGLGQDTVLLKKHGYKPDTSTDSPPKTMLIHLRKSQKELWEQLSSTCRYSINRANRYGVKVEILQKPLPEEIEKFHTLIARRGKTKKYYVQSLRDQNHKVKVFGDQAYIVNAYDKNNAILGTKMYLGVGNNIWYFAGGTTDLGQKSKGGYKLLWESILYFKRNGYEVLDLEGLEDTRLPKQTKNWHGYTEFKLKFGGEIVEYPLPYVKHLAFF